MYGKGNRTKRLEATVALNDMSIGWLCQVSSLEVLVKIVFGQPAE